MDSIAGLVGCGNRNVLLRKTLKRNKLLTLHHIPVLVRHHDLQDREKEKTATGVCGESREPPLLPPKSPLES